MAVVEDSTEALPAYCCSNSFILCNANSVPSELLTSKGKVSAIAVHILAKYMTSQGFIDRHENNEISGQGGNRKLVHIGCQRQSQSVIPVFCGSDKKPVK